MVKWILLGFLLLLILLLLQKVTVEFTYADDDILIKLKYLFFRMVLFPAPEKKEKKKRKKEKAKPEEKKPKPEEQKKTLSETISTGIDFLKPLPNTLRRLKEKLTVEKLKIYIRVAGEDAAETGIEYGRTCGIVFGALATLRNILQIHVKAIKIEPDFVNYKSEIQISGQLRIRVYAALICGIGYLIEYLKVLNNKDTEEAVKTKEIKGGVLK